ncbi:MAG: hypothetical protein AAEJ65_01605, partial [Planctomycetota bacterium]
MTKFFAFLSIVVCLAGGTRALAQDYLLYITSPTTAGLGGTLDQSANLDNNGEVVQGWSYGVCH